MIYAEKWNQETMTAERGIFFSIAEFVPYRKLGWSGTDQIDALADAEIQRETKDNIGT